MGEWSFTGLEFWWGVGVLLTALNYAIVAILVPRILILSRDPRGALAWIFFVLLVPPMGLFGFWVVGPGRLRLQKRLKKRQRPGVSPQVQSRIVRGSAEPPPIDERVLALSRVLGPPGPTACNDVRFCNDGPETFAIWERAIDAAEHHVHFEIYIFKRDETGVRMRDALLRALERGVKVRLLLDDAGTRMSGKRFFKPLVAAGGEVARFLPLNLFSRQISINHRNHRKILIVDGRVGFVGGYNVGDEYAGKAQPWRDSMVEVKGPLVHRMQEVFCRDWYQATGDETDDPLLFPEPERCGEVWGQLLVSGPTDAHWSPIYMLLLAAINQATTRVWLETPYFVPDRPFMIALVAAALRGVDVRVVVPRTPDHRVVAWAARSYYRELLAAGAKIYELPKVMLHAKTMTVDGNFATVGSTNFDQRSFRLNFESNGFFYGPQVAGEVEAAMRVTQSEAELVAPGKFSKRRWAERLLEAFARVFAPIL